MKMEVEAGESDVIQVKDEPLSDEEEYTIELKFGKMPEPDELGIDQTVRKKYIYISFSDYFFQILHFRCISYIITQCL